MGVGVEVGRTLTVDKIHEVVLQKSVELLAKNVKV